MKNILIKLILLLYFTGLLIFLLIFNFNWIRNTFFNHTPYINIGDIIGLLLIVLIFLHIVVISILSFINLYVKTNNDSSNLISKILVVIASLIMLVINSLIFIILFFLAKDYSNLILKTFNIISIVLIILSFPIIFYIKKSTMKLNKIFILVGIIISLSIPISLLLYVYPDIPGYTIDKLSGNNVNLKVYRLIESCSRKDNYMCEGDEFAWRCTSYTSLGDSVQSCLDIVDLIKENKLSTDLCYDLEYSQLVAYCLGRLDIDKCFEYAKSDATARRYCYMLDCRSNKEKYSSYSQAENYCVNLLIYGLSIDDCEFNYEDESLNDRKKKSCIDFYNNLNK